MKPNIYIILFILLIIPGHLFSEDSTFCSLGQAMYDSDGNFVSYHMFDPFICHEEVILSKMEPEDYKDSCYGSWANSDGDAVSEDWDDCPELQIYANIEFLEKKKEYFHRPCKVNNEKEFITALELATGTAYQNSYKDWILFRGLDYYQGEGEGCENSPESCTLELNYIVKPAYWAFEHICTVGVDEVDSKSNPIARYKFNKEGNIEKQIYNKDKKEWGYQSDPDKPNTWVKDDWEKDTTGWCANNETHCIINKRIEVKNGVKLTKPIVIDKQEQKTSTFRIEIKYKGTNSPNFPGISYNPEDVYDNKSIDGAPHQFIISGFDLTGQNFFGEMLPIYPDISKVSLTTDENLFDSPVSPIFIVNPFFGSGPVAGGMYEISDEECSSEYGMSSCYGAYFQVNEEGLTSIYVPDWVGVYLNNKFQFAACSKSLNATIFECDPDVILQTEAVLVTDPGIGNGANNWFSKIIIPADKIKNNAEYQFVFNWFARRPTGVKYKDGSTHDDIIPLVKRSVSSPLACTAGEAKFKGACIKATDCAANNGFLKKYPGHNDVCLLCAENETLIGNSCANQYYLSKCEAENRIWGTDSCGPCKPGFTDIGGVCINTASEKAACKAKPATHGKWTYNSTSNSCSFACDKGFIETAEGVCALKCDENGMVPNSNETACTCDSANHWVPYSGGGCMCEDGYTVSGDVCVSTDPPGPDACGSDSECDDDELCKDGKCQKEEPEPLGGECKANADCEEGHVCSSSQKCECDTVNNWNFNNLTAKCEHYEPTPGTICEDNDGYYYEIESRCVNDVTEAACLKSDGKWEKDVCWHDPDDDGEWTPDTDLPEENSDGSGCGTISNASLPQSLGSVLPYLLILGFVSLRGIRQRRMTKQSPASK